MTFPKFKTSVHGGTTLSDPPVFKDGLLKHTFKKFLSRIILSLLQIASSQFQDVKLG